LKTDKFIQLATKAILRGFEKFMCRFECRDFSRHWKSLYLHRLSEFIFGINNLSDSGSSLKEFFYA